MAQEYLATPKPPPALNVPSSEHTVRVSCIDSTTRLRLPMAPFLQPDYKGKEDLTGPAFSFLIEHSSGKRILFDLGTRKDLQSLPDPITKRFNELKWDIRVEKNVAEILKENGVDVGAIDSVLWSHHHWDHIGDMRTFPKSTELVVGPGFQKEHLPGFPENPESPIPAEDFKDRPVREVDIEKEGKGHKIGRFFAYDYFGDGSFYLLDTPGHSVGHMCGLARTTAGSNPTFIFMGGDASHHGGEFRPSEYLPLPAELDPSPVKSIGPVCPGHLLLDIHREKDATKPYYLVQKSFAHDLDVCNWTIAGLQEFDVDPNVLLLVAHDDSVIDALDLYPRPMNDWHQKSVAKKVKWKFLEDFAEAVKT